MTRPFRSPLRLRNLFLALPLALAVWSLFSIRYNRFLMASAGHLLRLTERGHVTQFLAHPQDLNRAYLSRLDFPPRRRLVAQFRITDVHFNLVLVLALFLAVPAVPWQKRFAQLGYACLAAALFHLLLLFFYAKTVYATQLGAWSIVHYGPVARNIYGMTWHLLDLPVKLALPFLLWIVFNYDRLPAVRRAAS